MQDPSHLLDRPLLYRPPKQQRSQKTLDRIATAALEVIEEQGLDGTTVAAIVDRSGASVGSFYARFPGKDNLVDYLRNRVWAEARERWDASLADATWAGLTVEQVVEGVVRLLYRSLHADFQRRRALGKEGSQDPAGVELARDFHVHVLGSLRPLLLARRAEILHPDPERAVALGYRIVVGAMRELLDPVGDAVQPDKDDLVRELSLAWLGYLGGGQRPEAAAAQGAVDFFDPWG